MLAAIALGAMSTFEGKEVNCSTGFVTARGSCSEEIGAGHGSGWGSKWTTRRRLLNATSDQINLSARWISKQTLIQTLKKLLANHGS